MIGNWTDFLNAGSKKAGVYLFIGKEEFLLTKVIESIKSKNRGEISVENYFLTKQKELLDILRKAMERSIFDSRIKIVKAELSRDFGMKRGAKEFISFVPKIPNYLILYGKNFNSRSKFVKFALENSIPVFYVYPLKESEKFSYVMNLLREYGIEYDRNVVAKILKYGPSELFLLESEIRKLSLFSEGKITEDDIEIVFSLKKEEKIENFLELIDTPAGKNVLRKLLREQYDPIYVWTSIINFFTTLFWFFFYKKEGEPDKIISNKLGVYPSKLSFYNFHTAKYKKRIADIIGKLYSLEKDFKYSSKDKAFLIESFIDYLIKINGGSNA